MDLSVRESAGRKAVLKLCAHRGSGYYWEVDVTDARPGVPAERLRSSDRYASAAKAASEGFKVFNSLAREAANSPAAPAGPFAASAA
ncbi:hypothetical protein V8Z80_02550 [Orrella sp. JC864]|uniref:hypothetical protein n=1 Tax=Orrella sp. JC864 TaxID=3120298 RepID=UPI0012BC1C0C